MKMATVDWRSAPFVAMSGWERLAVVVLVTMTVTAVGVVNLAHGRADLSMVWLGYCGYAVALALPFVLYRRDWGWLHPLVFTVVWWQLVRHVLPHLPVYAEGLASHAALPMAGPPELNAVVTESLLLTVLGTLSFYLGFLGVGDLQAPRIAFPPAQFLRIKVGLVAVVALGALAALAVEAGGVGALLLQRGLPADERIHAQLGGEHWKYLAGLLKPACLLWLAVRPHAWQSTFFWVMFAVAVAIDFAATGSRAGIILTALMAGAIWMLQHHRVPYAAVGVAAVVSLLVVGAVGEFRVASRGASELGELDLDVRPIRAIAQGYQEMAARASEKDGLYGIVGRVPEDVDWLYGASYLSVPFAPIPSALLSFEKPKAGGKLNAIRVFGERRTAIPPGNIGEAYWNFHIAGVLLVMLLFGVVMKWLARLFVVNAGAGWVVAVYVYTLFTLQPNSPAVYRWLHAMVPLGLLLLLFCGLPRWARAAEDRNSDM